MAKRNRVPFHSLPPREREILEAAFRRGEATIKELGSDLEAPPSPSAVRVMVARLIDKGWLRRKRVRDQLLYSPSADPSSVALSSLSRIIETFFDGSPVKTVQAILGSHDGPLSADVLAALTELVASNAESDASN